MKILLVDDHNLFREGLASLLRSQPGIEIVGEADSVQQAVEMTRTVRPDIILMDFELPDGDGTQAARVILAEHPGIKIVFLTIFETNDRLFTAIRSGASGYLLKNLPLSKLVSAIRALQNDEAAISGKMTTQLLNEFARLGPPGEPGKSRLSSLSIREVEILRKVSDGMSNQEIAVHMNISPTTVKNHVHSILVKLELKNRQEAANFARHQGLVLFNPPPFYNYEQAPVTR